MGAARMTPQMPHCGAECLVRVHWPTMADHGSRSVFSSAPAGAALALGAPVGLRGLPAAGAQVVDGVNAANVQGECQRKPEAVHL